MRGFQQGHVPKPAPGLLEQHSSTEKQNIACSPAAPAAWLPLPRPEGKVAGGWQTLQRPRGWEGDGNPAEAKGMAQGMEDPAKIRGLAQGMEDPAVVRGMARGMADSAKARWVAQGVADPAVIRRLGGGMAAGDSRPFQSHGHGRP